MLVFKPEDSQGRENMGSWIFETTSLSLLGERRLGGASWQWPLQKEQIPHPC